MIKAGVIGAGHLGKIHLHLLKSSKFYDLVGFYDSDRKNAEILNKEKGYRFFETIDELIENCEMVDIVTPTVFHHEIALKAIAKKKHVFIEKPIANSVIEAEEISIAARKLGVLGQVGHVERFNPALKAALDSITNPMFIESHRLAEFNPRGTDVPVVLDLMIHDIDILLSIIKSKVRSVSASGVSIISSTPDIANARIEFNNGCVCNLTASRMSLKNMRKSRVFQKDAYISIDYLEKKTEVIRLKNIKPSEEIDPLAVVIDLGKGKRKKQIYFENPNIEENNAIKDEFISFANAINEDIEPEVSITDGLRALELAVVILEKMKLNHQLNVV